MFDFLKKDAPQCLYHNYIPIQTQQLFWCLKNCKL